MRETSKLKETTKEQAKRQGLLESYMNLAQEHSRRREEVLQQRLAAYETKQTTLAQRLRELLGTDAPLTEEQRTLLDHLAHTESAPAEEDAEEISLPPFDVWVTQQVEEEPSAEELTEEEIEADPEIEEKETSEVPSGSPLRKVREPIEIMQDPPSGFPMALVEPHLTGFRVENGAIAYADSGSGASQTQEMVHGLVGAANDVPYYQCYFLGKAHTNYIVDDPERGVFIISIANPEGSAKEELKKFGTIVRHQDGTSILNLKSRNRIKKKIIQEFQLNPNTPWREIKDPNFAQELKSLEQKELQVRHRYKFALLLVKEGQDQREMFSNTEGSPDWDEFLSFMGDIVPLQDWKGYAGGLDTTTGTTGTHSLYLQHRGGLEVMFHVSTMIPASDSDVEQVERKRHLGNDVVVLVFKEGKTPFSPTVIRSHFNSVFVVVQKVQTEGPETYYQLTVTSRETVEPFPPFLPVTPIYKKNRAFRDLIVSKMMNGERATYQTPDFKARMARARLGAMRSIAREFTKK